MRTTRAVSDLAVISPKPTVVKTVTEVASVRVSGWVKFAAASATGTSATYPLGAVSGRGKGTSPVWDQARGLPCHTRRMDQTSITAAGAIDTFLVLLIGVGPKIALVPFVEITASLDRADKQRVLRKMLTTAAAVAVILMALGELLRALLHFTIGSLSIAGGVILLVLAVWMVLRRPPAAATAAPGKTRCSLRCSRWRCPTCSTRWGSSA